MLASPSTALTSWAASYQYQYHNPNAVTRLIDAWFPFKSYRPTCIQIPLPLCSEPQVANLSYSLVCHLLIAPTDSSADCYQGAHLYKLRPFMAGESKYTQGRRQHPNLLTAPLVPFLVQCSSSSSSRGSSRSSISRSSSRK